jgi:6-phosphogluconolactonase/glucosamine-6-phosphate isomerase/deaminase
VQIRIAPDPIAAADEAAAWTAWQLRNAVRRRGGASLAVSGGRTPASMFATLAALDVPWDSVTVYQVDERVAPDGDPARNAVLLDLLPVRPSNRRAMPVTARDLRAAARRYATSLPEQIDVVHLGLGDDGHTASWPPGDPVIDADAPVALCAEYRGYVRMTLTPVVVNAARHRLVLVTGADKASPMRRWLLGDTSLPVQRVRRSDTVVVLDAAAAAQLPRPSG